MAVSDLIADHLARQPRGGNARLAQQLGVTAATVTRWAKGESVPEEWRAAAIAKAIGSTEAKVLSAISHTKQQRHDSRAADLERVTRLESEVRELRELLEQLQRRARR